MPRIRAISFGLTLCALACLESVSWGQASAVIVREANVNWQRSGGAGDQVERVLLLTPVGPIVLQSTIFIDGQPQQALREKLVDDVLKRADADGDGQVTWQEALQNPRFLYAPARFAGVNEQQLEQARSAFMKQYDQNSDGTVDRAEVRLLLSRLAGGGGIVFSGGAIDYRSGGRADLKTLLDADRDGILSTEEIDAAPQRLKSRDANDNDLLEPGELDGGPAAIAGASRNFQVLALGSESDVGAIHSALLTRYGAEGRLTEGSFPQFPRWLDGLDRNANGELDKEEAAGFHSIRPHVAITVRFKTSESAPPEADATGITVNWLAPEFQERDILGRLVDAITLRLPGLRITITAPTGGPSMTANFRRSAEAMLANFDADKNGYLDKKELEGQANAQYMLQQFDRWDENGDGSVYSAEIEADYERQMAPQRSQVSLSASDRGSGLFGALDQSGDVRLSAREMRTAAERLLRLDADEDGSLSGTELPTEFQVVLNQGNRFGPVNQGANSGLNPASRTGAPKWFVHMDRNDDGDLTLREFLGSADQFQSLDRNGDGFIEPAEAAALQSR